MSTAKRSTRQIRKSLHETRERLDRDLTELQDRAEESLSPRNIIARHPAVMTIAGAIVGVLVVRNPALIGRTLTRVAQASVPLLVRSFLTKGGSALEQVADGNGTGADGESS